MNTRLIAKHVRKRYGDFEALRDASLELLTGETLALLGPNGAGKTTFIKILATLLTMDSGEVSIMGYDLVDQVDTARHLFGYVGQDTDRSAYARLTVRENLHFFGAMRGLSRFEIDAQIDKLASQFDFHGKTDKLFMHLSGGQKQTVVIMRSLLHDPPIIYLDEPTKGLDPIIARRIRTFLSDYVKREQKSLLLTSHILTEVDEMADRVALIHAGKIEATETPAQLKAAVGANEFIELDRSTLPEKTRQTILDLEPVLFEFDRHPDRVTFALNDFLDGSEAIIQTLRADNVQTQFYHHTVSLEDAFVHHVGELQHAFDQ